MRDPADFTLYRVSEKLKSRLRKVGDRRSEFIRIELLGLLRNGSLDLESRIEQCSTGAAASVYEFEEIVGTDLRRVFSDNRELMAGLRNRYTRGELNGETYRRIRDDALRAQGVEWRALVSQRANELMPSDHEASIDLDRRISIASEVLRAEALEREQSAQSKARVAAAESEQAYRRRVVRGAQPKRVPRIVRIAALLSTLGLLADVGGALAPSARFGASMSPSASQVWIAIAVGVMSAFVRGPFIASGLSGSVHWKPRARFQLQALLFLNGALSGLALMTLLADNAPAAAVGMVVGAAVVRLSWLAFWYWLLVQRTPEVLEH